MVNWTQIYPYQHFLLWGFWLLTLSIVYVLIISTLLFELNKRKLSWILHGETSGCSLFEYNNLALVCWCTATPPPTYTKKKKFYSTKIEFAISKLIINPIPPNLCFINQPPNEHDAPWSSNSTTAINHAMLLLLKCFICNIQVKALSYLSSHGHSYEHKCLLEWDTTHCNRNLQEFQIKCFPHIQVRMKKAESF